MTTAYVFCIAAIVIAYFLGNISPATIIAKAKGVDIRSEGSGNPGTTNVLRVMGKKAAALTLILDVVKGALAVLIGYAVVSHVHGTIAFAYEELLDNRLPIFALLRTLPFLCALFVVLGHIWPALYRFRGGKGIATALGALLMISVPMALLALAVFIVAVAITRYVSVGSLLAAVSVPFLAIYFVPEFFPISALMALIVMFKHKSNVERLAQGEETKLSFKK